MLEAEHLATLRIDAGHHVLDRAVFASSVHGLENQEHGIRVVSIQAILQLAEFFDLPVQQFLLLVLGFNEGRNSRWPLPQIDRGSFLDAELIRIDPHGFLMV
jgi:hypothetical protein